MRSRLHRIPLVIQLAVPAALAQGGLHPGLQLHAAQPGPGLQAWAAPRAAPGWGLHLALDLRDGYLLRPRFDQTRFTRVGEGPPLTDQALGLDLLFFPMQKPERTYLILGWGLHRWQSRADALDPGRPGRATTRGAVAAGLGYQVCAWSGVEVRYLAFPAVDLGPTAPPSPDSRKGRLDQVQAALTLTF